MTREQAGVDVEGTPRPRAVESVPWASAITYSDEERIWIRGMAIDEAIGTTSFAGMLLLLWTGARPEPAAERLLNACLAASVDHGPVTPSALAARTASSVRQNPVTSLAAGILAITDYHGGAVTPCMELLHEDAHGADTVLAWARTIAGQLRREGRRIPGIGHRTHVRDRRAERLLDFGRTTVSNPIYVDRVAALAQVVSEHAGRPIPVNIDGAVAACLNSVGLEPAYGTLAFAIARSAGLSAHIIEERARQRPMRTISPELFEYDGPQPAPSTSSTEQPQSGE